jgi:hypothetical protein
MATGTKFPYKAFIRFCNNLLVETKEDGVVRLGQVLLGTQRHVIEEIVRGLEGDVHEFVVLKGRQVGVTTIMLALDLFYAFRNKGLSATLVADEDSNASMFRNTLTMYMNGLPPEYRIPKVTHSKFELVPLGKVTLGQGKAIVYCHSTETASYGSEQGLDSLAASFAQSNPMRLFVWESTAKGFNHYHDRYEGAKRNKSQRAIFIGWWRNEKYSFASDHPFYKVYWDGRMTSEEKDRFREVKSLYGIELTSEQWAWYRWYHAEKSPDPMMMQQEFPTTETEAFVMSGSSYFSASRCTEAMKESKAILPESYRFSLGLKFVDTELFKCGERTATCQMWEAPVKDGVYVMGCDPAYGSSEQKDRFCIEVYRCYADGLDQVAEFCTADMENYQFAWVMCYFVGLYEDVTVNLEMNGPGQGVMSEIQNMKRLAASGMEGYGGPEMIRGMAKMKQYMWRRMDSVGGPGNSIGWITTMASKDTMMTMYKDSFERKLMTVRSKELLAEMKSIVRDGGSISAFGRGKDDRVMGTGLACAAYSMQVQPGLIARRMTRARAKSIEETGDNPVGSILELQIGRRLAMVGQRR